MVNYENSKVYKIEPICDHEEGEIYIGSTTKQYLSQRIDKHRNEYKYWKDGKRRKVMVFELFDKYGVTNCNIVLLENVNCNSKDELTARESHYIKTIKCINKRVEGRTVKEWYNDTIERQWQNSKNYYHNNKEKRKKYNEINKQKILELTKQKIYCNFCKCEVNKYCFKKHEGTIKHKNNLII